MEIMRARRRPGGRYERGGTGSRRDLVDGPGKLCSALGITGTLDGQRISGSEVTIRRGRRVPDTAVEITARVGITKAADWPLRFVARK
jgi:DNA-3-methyladenine glycosylase